MVRQPRVVVVSREDAGARGAPTTRRGEHGLKAATRERHGRSRLAGREDRRASIAESSARGRSDVRAAAQLRDTNPADGAPCGIRPRDNAQAVVRVEQVRETHRLARVHRLAGLVAAAGRSRATIVAARGIEAPSRTITKNHVSN